MKTLLLVDGNSILNRAFYGIRPLTASDGTFTQAVYGMVNILLRHLDALRPDYAACAFDRKEPTFRHQMYDGYKATRKGMPPELAMQLPYAKQATEALGLRLLSLAGYEADDLLGTGAQFSAADPDLMTYILTGDRDSLQLIRDNVHVLLAGTGETADMDRAAFGEKYPGVTPEQFVDVKALMGDTSDNIPGVRGIGEKSALSLISSYGSLDGLYEALPTASLTDSVRKKLTEGRDSAYLSQTLARICTSAPMGVTLTDLTRSPLDREAMDALLTRLELFSLRKRLGLDTPQTPAASPAASPAESAPASLPSLPEEIGIGALSSLPDPLGIALSGGILTVRTEEKTLFCRWDEPSGLMPFFAQKRTLAVRDSKELYRQLDEWGIAPGASLFDVTLAAYLLSPTDSKYELSRLTLTYLGAEIAGEAEAVYRLMPVLSEKLRESGQERLFSDLEMPLAKVLAEMERIGFRCDTEKLAQFGEMLAQKCEETQAKIYSLAGEPFNIASPKQLGTVLFEKLALPPEKKSAKGYSTDAETLEKLRPYHPIIDLILEYRQYTKLRSTYVEGLAKAADAEGRIHSVFNQTVTATGRLSSSEPNLQNIPVRTPLGREMRKFFVPRDGCVLIDADYSQIELRLLALISGDEQMTKAFREGVDVHAVTASRVFGVPLSEVTSELRSRAKAVNFGVIYGIGDYSLSQSLGISRKEAARYIESYLDHYPAVRDYMKETVAAARRDGYVSTLFGRRRAIPELFAPKKPIQAFGERIAMNSPIQGTAADVIKQAMVDVSRALRASGLDARLILQIHDELIIEARREDAPAAASVLRSCMEHPDWGVPLTVELGIGESWYECK